MSGAADITVLAAGGTIDKVYDLAGQLEIGQPAAQRLLEVLRTARRGLTRRRGDARRAVRILDSM